VTTFILNTAQRIIRAANREQPADLILKRELGARSEVSPRQAREISKTVFAYYRWFGWLNPQQPFSAQIQEAVELANTFTKNPQEFSDADLVTRAVPAWLHDQMDVTGPFARSLQTEPPLWLRARPGGGKDLAAKLGDCRVQGDGVQADTLQYLGTKDLFRTAEFHSGEFELQDLSSQAVGWLCAPRPAQTWWDACAGEGGKTLHLSALMQNNGLIWASDRAAWRLQKLKRRAARAGVFNYRSALWDGGTRLPTKTQFDGILIDAPCSGVGTWHRNPHARWTTSLDDVRELSGLQLQLLRHAAPALKPGGKLVYAVCTLTRSETTEVAAGFERMAPELMALTLTNPLEPALAQQSQISLWPQNLGGSGMFVAAWSRTQKNRGGKVPIPLSDLAS
jgi:16S rRNA (cytosine967-C5)-methyltransferase